MSNPERRDYYNEYKAEALQYKNWYRLTHRELCEVKHELAEVKEQLEGAKKQIDEVYDQILDEQYLKQCALDECDYYKNLYEDTKIKLAQSESREDIQAAQIKYLEALIKDRDLKIKHLKEQA